MKDDELSNEAREALLRSELADLIALGAIMAAVAATAFFFA